MFSTYLTPDFLLFYRGESGVSDNYVNGNLVGETPLSKKASSGKFTNIK